MDEIQRLKGSRAAYRSHVTRTLKKLDDVLEKDDPLSDPDIAKLTCHVEQLTQKKEVLQQLNTQIAAALQTSDDLQSDILESEEIQDTIMEYVSMVKHRVESTRPPPPASRPLNATAPLFTPTVPTREPVSRLPKLSLPTFSGDTLMWQSFRDSFDAAVHNCPSITKIQKFNYLKAQLHGDALRTIAGLPLTESNYDDAITLLTRKYGQPHKIVQAHMQALIEIASPTNSLSSLQLFYDTIEMHIRGLKALGTTEESYGAMLVPIILTRLPIDIRRNLAREHGSSEWTINQLKEAILKEIGVLESVLSPLHKHSYETHMDPMTTALHTNTNSHHTQRSRSSCLFCKGTHPSTRCEKVKNPNQRLEIVKKGKNCFNCLGHHRVSQCTSKFRCKSCKQKHHSSLCGAEFTKPPDVTVKPETTSQTTMEQRTAVTTTTETTSDNPTAVTAAIIPPGSTTKPVNSSVCLLKTAVASVCANGRRTDANILFDEGAQRSFMSNKLAKKLRISPYSCENINISAFGGEPTAFKQLGVTTIDVETLSGEHITLSVLLVPMIAAPLQNTCHTQLLQMKHLNGLQLANPVTKDSMFEISLLIGADYYWQFVGDHIVRGEGPTAMQSKLGYLLSGPLTPATAPLLETSVLYVSIPIEEDNLSHHWEAELTTTDIGTDTSDQDIFDCYLQSHIKREDDGAYCVKFPWKQDHPALPSNYTVCTKKTRSLARKLSQEPELLQLYGKIIQEQEQRDFIERVPVPDLSADVHYIPHHPVRKASPTTPIRIVYNCSFRSSGNPSLNDCLLTGPSLLTDMCGILLRFRSHPIGISTDLEKAFLHVRLDKEDRNYTRFLWLASPLDPESELVVYRFKTVLFGSTSSPFMLHATLFRHLTSYNTPVANDMKNNLYVDNIISGCMTTLQAIQYYKESRSIMNDAKFNLRAWASNCTELRTLSAKEDTADNNTIVNLLGLLWNTSTDTIGYIVTQFHLKDQPITKRRVLQLSSKIYDPLGFLAPVTIQARILMQELWRCGVSWDEPLQQEHVDTWQRIVEHLQDTTDILLPRCYLMPMSDAPKKLHVFCDASKKAYGAVIYICEGDQTSFVMAKTRVVPMKSHTLPRLELMAAVVGSRLCKFVLKSLHHLSFDVTMWSDSQITLHWLFSKKKLQQFVSNRVNEIHRLLPNFTWHYCPTECNPADLLTRGISSQCLKTSDLWHHGPDWLTQESQWPTWNVSEVLHLQVEELVADTCTLVTHSSTTIPGIHNIVLVSKYSTLQRLLRVSAYVLRFIHNIKHHNNHKKGPLSTAEIDTTRHQWIYVCQHTSFHKEIHHLQTNKGKRIPIIRQLRLFLDEFGYLRCGGRIHNAPVSSDTKFPYLMPKSHLLTRLIVYAVHQEQLHTGVSNTVAALRQQYWIPSGRQLVKRLLRKCVVCLKVLGKSYPIPESPPLPQSRTKEGRPFEITGVDFTGALHVKNSGCDSKVYICLFTCGLSRAIHLEVVTDLSTETFLQAFRRFVSRKSLPSVMISDNASTFESAAEELRKLFISRELVEALSARGVRWNFIPKRAPWYGGFWERLIGMTKTVARKVLGRSFITLESLQTLVVEIEAVLNDRPLTYQSADITDPEPLTPSHLLYGRRITSLPYAITENEELADPTYSTGTRLRDRAQRQEQLLHHFQTRWKREYLTALREAHKGGGVKEQIVKVGDIVLVHDDVPRARWRLAVIEELIKGLDGLTRSAKIRTKAGRTNRPIAKLYPLEVNSASETAATPASSNNETASTDNGDVQVSMDVNTSCPRV
ncbi:uncharacterized protein [Dysidea avara]|uniref:uncharacterized protein n=1 Tax=Dysidea avara TaxID=196820 RepID=UPI00332F93D1